MFSKKVLTSLIIDYVTVAVIIAIHFVAELIPPHERKFSITDESISYQYLGNEQISDISVIAIVSIVPSIISFIIIAITKGNSYEYHQFILTLATAVGLTIGFVDFSKALFGRFRPDFLSRCNIDYSKVDEIVASTYSIGGLPVGENRLFDLSICSNNNTKVLDEGRRSFPSGHASSSFSSFMILSLFIAGRLRVFNNRFCIWRLLLSSLPLFGAIYIVSTRYQDNLHHWSDLLAGTIIGCLISVIVYHFFYPPLNSEISDKPYQYKYEELTNDIEPVNDSNITMSELDKEYSKLV